MCERLIPVRAARDQSLAHIFGDQLSRLFPDYTKPAGGKVIKTFHLAQAEARVGGRNNSPSVLD